MLERSLGHITHADNLARLLPDETARSDAELHESCPTTSTGSGRAIPVYNSNWTVRAGVRARRGIRQMRATSEPLDALFIHTQVPAVLSPDWMRRIPTVVSLDATPLQYDELGAHYAHEPGHAPLEWLKYRANRGVPRSRAVHVVTWSRVGQAAASSTATASTRPKVTVVPPGVDPVAVVPAGRARRRAGRCASSSSAATSQRKGGDVLLDAFAALRQDLARPSGAADVELHLVTQAAGGAERQGCIVHHGLAAQQPRADRPLPPRRHLLPADPRATACRWCCRRRARPACRSSPPPSPASPRSSATARPGCVVPVDDVDALTKALRTLVEAPDLRGRLGTAAQELVTASFDADKNAARLVELLLAEAVPRTPRSRRGA